jgi:lipopolysaccharide export system permease protein
MILQRYLIIEIAKMFFAIVVTLLFISLSILLLRTLEEINLGALNIQVAFRFLGYQILRDSAHLLPPAFFLAILLALGRFARDSEMIALQACGIGSFHLYKALFYLAAPLIILTTWLALVVQPNAAAQIQIIRKLQHEQIAQLAGLRAGRYYQQDDGYITFYARTIDDQRRFKDIFLQDRRAQRIRIVVADAGYYQEDFNTGQRFIILERGRRYDGVPGTANYSIAEFEHYQLQLEQHNPSHAVRRKQSSRYTRDLSVIDNKADRLEFEHRLANPIAIITLTLIAIPLTTVSPRQTATWRIALAMLAYFAFFNLQRVAESWFENGVTPNWLGSLWYQVMIVFIVVVVLIPGSFWFQRLRHVSGRTFKKLQWRR